MRHERRICINNVGKISVFETSNMWVNNMNNIGRHTSLLILLWSDLYDAAITDRSLGHVVFSQVQL